MMKKILGLAGEMACGKGTVTKYIAEKYGAKTWRFSTILRDVMDRLSIEQSRPNFQLLSRILRENFGEDLFARAMAEDIKKSTADIIVIDGVRRLADIKYLRELPDFKLVYLEADIKNCYERIIKRDENSDDRKKTYEDFRKDREGESELQIAGLKDRADLILDNNGDYDNLYRQVDAIFKN